MSDWLLSSLFFLLVFNPAVLVRLLPAGGAHMVDRVTLRRWIPGFLVSLLLLAIAALLSGSILDLLDLSHSTFQIATGMLVICGALQAFLAIGVRVDNESESWANVGLLVWLLSPAPLALAVSTGEGDGAGIAVSALLFASVLSVALALSWRQWRGSEDTAILGWLRRLFAAAAVVGAIDLVRQGVENV